MSNGRKLFIVLVLALIAAGPPQWDTSDSTLDFNGGGIKGVSTLDTTGAFSTTGPITVIGDPDGQGLVQSVAAPAAGAAATTCLPESTSIEGCNDSSASVWITKTNDNGTPHVIQWAASANAFNTNGKTKWILEKKTDNDAWVYVASFLERGVGSSSGGAAADFDVNGVITTGNGTFFVPYGKEGGVDLGVGSCTPVGAFFKDTGNTAEMCHCSTLNVWDCWTIDTPNGPAD